MIIYLAYIKYDPEFSDLISAHLSSDTASAAASTAAARKMNEEKEFWKDDPDQLQYIEIRHWVTPIQLRE